MKSISIKWTNRHELEDKLDYLATQYARMEFISRTNRGVRMCDTYACYPIYIENYEPMRERIF